MPLTLEQLREYKPKILAYADQYGICNIRVFGSVARGDADEQSDIDLLVETSSKTNLFDIVEFKRHLSHLVHQHVDIVEIDAVKNPLRKKYILSDVVPL